MRRRVGAAHDDGERNLVAQDRGAAVQHPDLKDVGRRRRPARRGPGEQSGGGVDGRLRAGRHRGQDGEGLIGVAEVGGMHVVIAQAQLALHAGIHPALLHVEVGAIHRVGHFAHDGVVVGLGRRKRAGQPRVGAQQQHAAAGGLGFVNQADEVGAVGIGVRLRGVIVRGEADDREIGIERLQERARVLPARFAGLGAVAAHVVDAHAAGRGAPLRAPEADVSPGARRGVDAEAVRAVGAERNDEGGIGVGGGQRVEGHRCSPIHLPGGRTGSAVGRAEGVEHQINLGAVAHEIDLHPDADSAAVTRAAKRAEFRRGERRPGAAEHPGRPDGAAGDRAIERGDTAARGTVGGLERGAQHGQPGFAIQIRGDETLGDRVAQTHDVQQVPRLRPAPPVPQRARVLHQARLRENIRHRLDQAPGEGVAGVGIGGGHGLRQQHPGRGGAHRRRRDGGRLVRRGDEGDGEGARGGGALRIGDGDRDGDHPGVVAGRREGDGAVGGAATEGDVHVRHERGHGGGGAEAQGVRGAFQIRDGEGQRADGDATGEGLIGDGRKRRRIVDRRDGQEEDVGGACGVGVGDDDGDERGSELVRHRRERECAVGARAAEREGGQRQERQVGGGEGKAEQRRGRVGIEDREGQRTGDAILGHGLVGDGGDGRGLVGEGRQRGAALEDRDHFRSTERRAVEADIVDGTGEPEVIREVAAEQEGIGIARRHGRRGLRALQVAVDVEPHRGPVVGGGDVAPDLGRPVGGGGFHHGRAGVEHEGQSPVVGGEVEDEPVAEKFLEQVLAPAGGVDEFRGPDPEGEREVGADVQRRAARRGHILVGRGEMEGVVVAAGHARRGVDEGAGIGAKTVEGGGSGDFIEVPPTDEVVRDGRRSIRDRGHDYAHRQGERRAKGQAVVSLDRDQALPGLVQRRVKRHGAIGAAPAEDDSAIGNQRRVGHREPEQDVGARTVRVEDGQGQRRRCRAHGGRDRGHGRKEGRDVRAQGDDRHGLRGAHRRESVIGDAQLEGVRGGGWSGDRRPGEPSVARMDGGRRRGEQGGQEHSGLVGVAKIVGMHIVAAEAERALGVGVPPAFQHVEKGAIHRVGQLPKNVMIGGLREGSGADETGIAADEQDAAAAELGLIDQVHHVRPVGVRVGLRGIIVGRKPDEGEVRRELAQVAARIGIAGLSGPGAGAPDVVNAHAGGAGAAFRAPEADRFARGGGHVDAQGVRSVGAQRDGERRIGEARREGIERRGWPAIHLPGGGSHGIAGQAEGREHLINLRSVADEIDLRAAAGAAAVAGKAEGTVLGVGKRIPGAGELPIRDQPAAGVAVEGSQAPAAVAQRGLKAGAHEGQPRPGVVIRGEETFRDRIAHRDDLQGVGGLGARPPLAQRAGVLDLARGALHAARPGRDQAPRQGVEGQIGIGGAVCVSRRGASLNRQQRRWIDGGRAVRRVGERDSKAGRGRRALGIGDANRDVDHARAVGGGGEGDGAVGAAAAESDRGVRDQRGHGRGRAESEHRGVRVHITDGEGQGADGHPGDGALTRRRDDERRTVGGRRCVGDVAGVVNGHDRVGRKRGVIKLRVIHAAGEENVLRSVAADLERIGAEGGQDRGGLRAFEDAVDVNLHCRAVVGAGDVLPLIGGPGGGGGFDDGRTSVEQEGEPPVARGEIPQQPVTQELDEHVLAPAGGVDELRGSDPQGEAEVVADVEGLVGENLDVLIGAVEGQRSRAHLARDAGRPVDEFARVDSHAVRRDKAAGFVEAPATDQRGGLLVGHGEGGGVRHAAAGAGDFDHVNPVVRRCHRGQGERRGGPSGQGRTVEHPAEGERPGARGRRAEDGGLSREEDDIGQRSGGGVGQHREGGGVGDAVAEAGDGDGVKARVGGGDGGEGERGIGFAAQRSSIQGPLEGERPGPARRGVEHRRFPGASHEAGERRDEGGRVDGQSRAVRRLAAGAGDDHGVKTGVSSSHGGAMETGIGFARKRRAVQPPGVLERA